MKFVSCLLKVMIYSIAIIFTANAGLAIDQFHETSPLLDSKKGVFDLHQVHAQSARIPVWPLEQNVPLNLSYLNVTKLREDCDKEFQKLYGNNAPTPYKVGLFCVMNLSLAPFTLASYTLQPRMFYIFASAFNESETTVHILNEDIVFAEQAVIDKIIGVHTFGVHLTAVPISSPFMSKVIVIGENTSLESQTKEAILIKFRQYQQEEKSIKLNALLIPQFWCFLEDPAAYEKNLKSKKVIFFREETLSLNVPSSQAEFVKS